MSRLDDILKIGVERIQLGNGRIPFDEWFECLDVSIRARVAARVRRLAAGNFGDCKYLGSCVSELRLAFGPGYRIYFGQSGQHSIFLISGGIKRTQRDDIRRAKKIWAKLRRNEIDGR